MVVCQLAGGSSEAKEVPGGQADVVHHKALVPVISSIHTCVNLRSTGGREGRGGEGRGWGRGGDGRGGAQHAQGEGARRTHSQHPIHVGDDGEGVVWLGSELAVAAGDLAVSAIPVVVVVECAIVDHCRDERVFMLWGGTAESAAPTHLQPI